MSLSLESNQIYESCFVFSPLDNFNIFAMALIIGLISISKSKSMQGIALGRCRKSDGMIFYCPHNKQLYTSSDYKLDEGRSTPTTFKLRYDGGIFVGLCNNNSPTTSTESYPEGMPVPFPIRSPPLGSSPVYMRGTVISVPIQALTTQLPFSDNDAPPYVVHLVDGTIHSVSPDFLSSIISNPLPTSPKFNFPTWLGNTQKVMYLHNGEYLKGVMEWDLDNITWHFSQRRCNGTEVFGVSLPNFSSSYQQYIDNGTLPRLAPESELSACW
jgi:hypothetical protein